MWVENPRTLELVPLILRAGQADLDNEEDNGDEDGDGLLSKEDEVFPDSLEDKGAFRVDGMNLLSDDNSSDFNENNVRYSE